MERGKPRELHIKSGVVKVSINGDPDKIISFNPAGVVFARKFYALFDALEKQTREGIKTLNEAEKHIELDEAGIPRGEGMVAVFGAYEELTVRTAAGIDDLFGAGTSARVFGPDPSFDELLLFFEGLADIVAEARGERIEGHISEPEATIT